MIVALLSEDKVAVARRDCLFRVRSNQASGAIILLDTLVRNAVALVVKLRVLDGSLQRQPHPIAGGTPIVARRA